MRMTRTAVIAAAILAIAIVGAVADTSTTLHLQGTVAEVIDISISAFTLSVILPLTDGTAFDGVVAELRYSSNTPEGFTIAVGSMNNFYLLGPEPGRGIPYAVRVGATGTSVDADSTNFEVVSSGRPASSTTCDVYVRYDASRLSHPGRYSDILTFEIAGK